GEDPYAVVRSILGGGSMRLAASERMWATHLMALTRELGRADFVPASRVLSRLRSRKDAAELRLLAAAASAADEAFRRLVGDGLEGRSEQDVAKGLSGHLLDAGHGSVGFTIVGGGPNGASPHHEPAGRVIRQGDAVVLDFGGRVGGYCSDVTRTVSVGEPPEEVREVHDVVHRAQADAFRSVRPGVPAEEVDRAARAVIEEAGFGAEFVHRTGHGIGLEEHEPPYIVAGNGEPLEPGMAFSIEPGIYLPGRFGVRIEDIVVVTADGAKNLNDAPRELLIVG
ncbi:MAG TPA: M24 family metallopeptidase, partial [Actinomycetota bacterium]|nr:M24 family metallopeptidase [Actinomycetota bacterium]